MRVGEWVQCIGEEVESFVEERVEKVREFEYNNKSALVYAHSQREWRRPTDFVQSTLLGYAQCRGNQADKHWELSQPCHT